MTVLDHLVYAVADLDAACHDVEDRTGVRPALGGSHPGMGTHNALASFGYGHAYLELIAPDPDQATPAGPRPFGIDELDGAGLVAFAVRPEPGRTLDEVVATARGRGYDPGDPLAMSRRQPDGHDLHWRLTLPPADRSGAVPFLIDWGATPMPASTAPAGLQLAEFAVTDPDPAALGEIYAALDIPIRLSAGDATALTATIAGPAGTISLGPPRSPTTTP